MHFRWLQCVAVLLVTLSSTQASLTDLDPAAFITFIKTSPLPPSLILLYDETPQSQEAEEMLELMLSNDELGQYIPGVQLFKQKQGDALSTVHNIKTFPALVLMRDDSSAYYTGAMGEEVYFWLEKAGAHRVTKELGDKSFEHLTQASTGSTTGSWLVLFYREQCSDHASLVESLAVNEKLWMNVAMVDLDSNPALDKRFKITSCPELIYFREGKMYRYETKKYDLPSVHSFVTSWFRNVKASPVPLQPTAFDSLTEGIAKYLKTQIEGENRNLTMAVMAGFGITLVLTLVFCCMTGGSDSKQKKE